MTESAATFRTPSLRNSADSGAAVWNIAVLVVFPKQKRSVESVG